MSNATQNLDAPYISSSQNQPEVTANSAFDVFDGAIGSLLSHAMSDADYTLNTAATPDEVTNYIAYYFTGALSATRNIIIPSDPLTSTFNKKLFAVFNATTGGHSIVLKTSSGTGVTIAPSTTSYTLCYCDGTNVVAVGTGSGSSITLETNGVSNGSQTLLNLVAGANVTIVDGGSGSITISATGGGSGSGFEYLAQLLDVLITSPTDGQVLTYNATAGKWENQTPASGGITLETNGSANADQSVLNLKAGTNVTLTADGSGGVTIAASGGGGGGGFSSLAGFRRLMIVVADGTTNLTAIACQGDLLSKIRSDNSEVDATAVFGTNPTWSTFGPNNFGDQTGVNGLQAYNTGTNINAQAIAAIKRTTDVDFWFVLASAVGSGYGSQGFGPGGSVTGGVKYAGFRFSTSQGDTDWQCVTSDGSSTTVTSSGIAADANVHTFLIVFNDSAPSVEFYIDGSLVATNTTHLPASTTLGMELSAGEPATFTPSIMRIVQIAIQSDN